MTSKTMTLAEQAYAAANDWQRLGERVDSHLLALSGAKSLIRREGTDVLTFEDGSQLVFYPRSWEWVTPITETRAVTTGRNRQMHARHRT